MTEDIVENGRDEYCDPLSIYNRGSGVENQR